MEHAGSGDVEEAREGGGVRSRKLGRISGEGGGEGKEKGADAAGTATPSGGTGKQAGTPPGQGGAPCGILAARTRWAERAKIQKEPLAYFNEMAHQ